LLGFPTSDMSSTIPFFAAPRIDSTALDMTGQSDPPNVQQIPSPLISVVIRRLRSRSADLDDAVDGVGKPSLNWRYVVGAFQINIPVAAARTLLPVEESILAVYKWKLEQVPAANRWHPVLERYEFTGKVSAVDFSRFGAGAAVPARLIRRRPKMLLRSVRYLMWISSVFRAAERRS
jgi:hypothetical protein